MPDIHIQLPGYVVEEAFREPGDMVVIRAQPADGGARVLFRLPSGARPDPSVITRLEHELALRASLDPAWALVPQAIARFPEGPALQLDDAGGRPLHALGGFQAPEAFFPLAIAIARAVAGMHAAQLVHKNLAPEHLWLDPAGGIRLTGFGLASPLPAERSRVMAGPLRAGMLDYMAPEQTGRLNRLIDERSDLYALGAVFYEILTGQPPCQGDDPLSRIYCHLAIVPPSPRERVPTTPSALSAIVMKLLAKDPEDRYQTAIGLVADLLTANERWRSGEHGAFEPGAHDVPERLRIAQRLYGRERELSELTAAFERVASTGRFELVLVSGNPGVGKSSLVQELRWPVLRARGQFLSGKFELDSRSVPYATFTEAFRVWFQQILAESDRDELAWKRLLGEALGPNAKLLVEVFPLLARLLGPLPPVPELPAPEAQRRFLEVFRRLIWTIARSERPLVLFLDDLQWADPASLKLLQELALDARARNLLVIGAYRDVEVGPVHPLRGAIAALRERTAVRDVVLGPLGPEAIACLVADVLRCNLAEAAPLARLVDQKTGGNPFFAIQFLRMLRHDRLITFEPEARAWRWDLPAIQARGFSDNVVDLMIQKLACFPPATRDALGLAACVGDTVALPTLAAVMGRTPSATEHDLQAAFQEELLVREGEQYRFLHDRVRQAAYALVPEARRGELHLRIGRAMLAEAGTGVAEAEAFSIAGQFHHALHLIEDRQEQERVAEFEQLAGHRAEAAAAYEAAGGYYADGLALLGPAAWQEHYALAFSLSLGKARCEWLSGDTATAEALLADVRTLARDAIDRARASSLLLLIRETRGEIASAVDVALEALAGLGERMPHQPTREQADEALAEVWAALGDRPIEALAALPIAQDPRKVWTLELLGQLGTPANWFDQNLFTLVASRAVSTSIAFGHTDATAMAYAAFALALIMRDERLEQAYAFGKLAYASVQRRELLAYKARTCLVFGNMINYWRKPYRTDLPYLEEGYAAALEAGDLNYASYNLNHLAVAKLAMGEPLPLVLAAVERARAFAREAGLQWMEDLIVAQERLVLALEGKTSGLASWDDAHFGARAYEATVEARGVAITICWWFLYRTQALLFAGDFQGALDAARRARPLLATSTGQPIAVEFRFHEALAIAAACPAEPGPERDVALSALSEAAERFDAWGRQSPENFRHKALLLQAELARLAGDPLAAEARYEEALVGARGAGFVQNQALAAERAAAFYAARGLETLARAHVREASDAYAQWGAVAKVRQLEERHPAWIDRTRASSRPLDTSSQQLDLRAVLEVSQAISREIRLPALAQALMRAVLASTGAQRGCLLLAREGGLRVVAEAAGTSPAVLHLEHPLGVDGRVPRTIVHYVQRTHEPVVLDQAALQGPFADPTLALPPPKAALGYPVLQQSRLVGMLYLEHALTADIFTTERLTVLALLGAQAAISLENAMLLADVQQARERLQAILDHSPAMIVVRDTDGRLMFANVWFERVFRRDRERLLGTTVADLFPRELAELIAARDREVLAHGRLIKQDLEVVQDDGVHTYMAARFPLTGADGKPYAVCSIATDITERLRADAERTRLLLGEQKARAELEAARELDRLRTRFTNAVTHDLRIPVTVIVGYAELLQEGLAGPLTAEQQNYVGQILHSTQRLEGLVNDMLDFARMEAGTFRLEPAEADLAATIQAVVDGLRPAAEAAGIALGVAIAAEPLIASFDERRIEQVLGNLIGNALKFTPRGGSVTVGACRDGAWLRCEVADTGEGIAPEDVPRLFQPFSQLESGARKRGGTGLGLATSRGIVEAHGGQIGVESAPGQGSTFWFTLPTA